MGLPRGSVSPCRIPISRGESYGSERFKNSTSISSRHHRHQNRSPSPSPPPPSESARGGKIYSTRYNTRLPSANYKQPSPRIRQPSDSSYMPPRGNRPSNLPSFDKDFGPFGMVHRKKHFNNSNNTNDTRDINSMFRRPEYDASIIGRSDKHSGRFAEPARSMTPIKRGDSGEYVPGLTRERTWDSGMNDISSKENGNPLLRSQLPPPNHPIVNGSINSIPSSGRRSVNRNEDLDRILAKYGKSSRPNVNVERDPDFSAVVRTDTTLRVTTDNRYSNNGGANGVSAFWDAQGNQQQHEDERDILTKLNNAVQQRGRPSSTENLQGHLAHSRMLQLQGPDGPMIALPLNTVDKQQGSVFQVAQQQHQHLQQHEDSKHDNTNQVLRRSTHVFPFKETPSGHLVIDPVQIAFESRKISVLVSDPNNNTATVEFTTTKCGANGLLFPPQPHATGSFTNKNERILHEVKKAMSIQETNENTMRKNSDGKLALTQKPRELSQKTYSESKKASSEFEESILSRLVSGRNADTHVMIGDKIFSCHSIALEACSTYFDKLTRPPETIQRIQLPEAEVSATAFPILVDWIVQSEEGRRGILTKENLVSLYAAARHLGMKDLELQCISFMERSVDSNDPDLLSMWDDVKRRRSGCSELVRIISSKMAASYHEIYKARRFLLMEVDELFMLLSSDDISIDSEMDVYESSVAWLLHDWKNRKVQTNKIMSTVRFGLLSPLQLTQINLCPELNKVKNEKDYNQILTYGTVKSMIDDGLAYSILDESYKNQPEELKRWVDKTGVKGPAPRTCLVNRKRGSALILEKISLLEDASQTKLRASFTKTPEKASSYTLLDSIPKPGTPILDSSSQSFVCSTHASLTNTTCEGGRRNSNNRTVARSKSRIPKLSAPTSRNPSFTDKLGHINNNGNSQSPDMIVNSNHGSTVMVMHELSKPKLLSNSSNTLQHAGSEIYRPIPLTDYHHESDSSYGTRENYEQFNSIK